MIFGSVVKKSCDHHIFRDGEAGVTGFTHDQRRNAKKMRHVGNAGSFTPFDVNVTSIVYGAREPASQVELFGLVGARAFVFFRHITLFTQLHSEFLSTVPLGRFSRFPGRGDAIVAQIKTDCSLPQ
jgi:hypothetical protein